MFCIFCGAFYSTGYFQRWRITCLCPVKYNHDELHEEWVRFLSRGRFIATELWPEGRGFHYLEELLVTKSSQQCLDPESSGRLWEFLCYTHHQVDLIPC